MINRLCGGDCAWKVEISMPSTLQALEARRIRTGVSNGLKKWKPSLKSKQRYKGLQEVGRQEPDGCP